MNCHRRDWITIVHKSFCQAKVEIDNIHMMQSLSNSELTRLGLTTIGDWVRLHTKVMEWSIHIHIRTGRHTAISKTPGSTSSQRQLITTNSGFIVILLNIWSNLGIYENFCEFYNIFKSFILKIFKVEWFKNCCSGEQCGLELFSQ